MRLKDVRQLEHDDLERRAQVARDEDAALRRAERQERHRAAWPRWVAFWERRAKEITIAAKVAGGAATIVAVLVAGYKNGAAAWHKATRAWSFYAHRGAGPPAQPPPTGAPTTALDFQVTAPRPAPRKETPTKD